MKFNVLKDIDEFEKKYLSVLQALADAWIGKKYTVVLSREGLSFISKSDKTIHIDPTGRLMYLYAMGTYPLICSHASFREFDPNDVGETMFFYAKTALLHEVLHALHTDSAAVCEYMNRFKTLADLRVFHSIFNCIEDGYIEYRFADDLYENSSNLLYEMRRIQNDAILNPRYAVTIAASNAKLNSTAPFSNFDITDGDSETFQKIKRTLIQLYDYLNLVLFLSTEDDLDIDDIIQKFNLNNLPGLYELYGILPVYYDELDIVGRLDVSLQAYEIIKKHVENFEILYDYFDRKNFREELCINDCRRFSAYDGWQQNYGKFVNCRGIKTFTDILETENGAEVIAHKTQSTADSETVFLERVRIDENAGGLKVNIKEYEDKHSYRTNKRNDGTEIELNYKRESDIWIKISQDKSIPILKDFFVHAVKRDYSKANEQKFKNVCNRNIAQIKAIEQAMLSFLSSAKHGVLRKQTFGIMLDSRNLADAKSRVFLKPAPSIATDFDLSVLIDMSGSVTKKAYTEICTKTICFIKACDNLGISARVQTFCSVNGKSNIYLDTCKDFSESIISLSSLFNDTHGEFNSFDLLAIHNIKSSLKNSSQMRHVVLYVTDGQGFYIDKDGKRYSTISCKKEIERIRANMLRCGIVLLPLCFDSASAKQMLNAFCDAVCCKSLPEIKTTLVPKIAEGLWRI